jgi:hypothetical protein
VSIDDARVYLERGWAPIPLPSGKRHPPPAGLTGYKGRCITHRNVTSYDWSGNIALRLWPFVVGLDIDAYKNKGGGESLLQLFDKLGPAPATVAAINGREDGSGIRLYRIPVGELLATNPEPGIDLIQAHHRYVVCAPSIHPDGRSYRWVDERTDEFIDWPPPPQELPYLPAKWVKYLAAAESKKASASSAADPEAVADFLEAHTENGHPKALRGVLSTLDKVGEGGRHDALVRTLCWAMREVAAGWYPAASAIDQIWSWWSVAVAGEGRADDPFEGEFAGALLWAIGQLDTAEEEIAAKRAELHETWVVVDDEELENEQESVAVDGLPDEFWIRTSLLAALSAHAYARMLAPAAVLGAALARVAAYIPPRIVLPPIVGSVGSLNVYVALVAPSGVGKSTAVAAARDVVEWKDPYLWGSMGFTRQGAHGEVHEYVLGSGQGMAEQYYGIETATGEDGKKHRQRVIVRNRALAYRDEGEALIALAAQKGATQLSTLRQMWTGAAAGAGNASEDRQRYLAPHSYRLALVAAFQPEAARGVLEGHHVGTPQRFLWLPATDATVPAGAPTVDTRIKWDPPAYAPGTELLEVDVPASVLAEVRDAHYARLTNGRGDDLDSHRNLNRLKLMVLLGALHGAAAPTLEHWAMAGEVMALSDRSRAATLDELNARRRAAERAATARAVRQHRAMADSDDRRYEQQLEQAARAIATKLHRDRGQSFSARQCRDAIAGRLRRSVDYHDALGEAVQREWIAHGEGGRYFAGERQP